MDRTSTSAASPRTLSSRLREDQSGAIIILALAFITIVLALAVGVLSLAFTGSSSLRAYRMERHRRYATDAAMQSAVQYVRQNPLIGVSGASPPACGMNYLVQEDAASGGAIQVFTAGSVLNVTCGATPGQDSGVRETGDPRTAPNGGQGPRDVTFTVSCSYNTIPAKGTLTCASGGANTLLLGRARVRYDVDYGIDPKVPVGGGLLCGPFDDAVDPAPTNPDGPGNLCTASWVRAVVPKIVYWSLKGG